jgi:hypothetical protein
LRTALERYTEQVAARASATEGTGVDACVSITKFYRGKLCVMGMRRARRNWAYLADGESQLSGRLTCIEYSLCASTNTEIMGKYE